MTHDQNSTDDKNASSDRCRDYAVELHQMITAALVSECRQPESVATVLAEKIADGVRAHAGGDLFYIPVIDKKKLARKIQAEYNGKNRKQLMQKYGISESTFRRYLSI